jgi:hypothetical protein
MAIDIDAKDLANQLTIEARVKNFNQWKIRIWIGTKLIQLAGWVMWANIEFIEDEV